MISSCHTVAPQAHQMQTSNAHLYFSLLNISQMFICLFLRHKTGLSMHLFAEVNMGYIPFSTKRDSRALQQLSLMNFFRGLMFLFQRGRIEHPSHHAVAKSAEKEIGAWFTGRTTQLCGDEPDSDPCTLWLVNCYCNSQVDSNLLSWDPAVLEKHCSCSS